MYVHVLIKSTGNIISFNSNQPSKSSTSNWDQAVPNFMVDIKSMASMTTLT